MGWRSTVAAWIVRAPEGEVRPVREGKSAGAGTLLLAGMTLADGEGAERSYEALARQGFMRNPVVYRAVRLIAESVAAIPILAYRGTAEAEGHPALELLARPQPGEDGAGLIEALCGHLLLSGNAYLEAAAVEGRVRGLHALRPDRVRIVAGRDGWPEAYEYRLGSHVRRIAAEAGEEPGRVLHLRFFHPLADAHGFAPLSAAAGALDLHNAAGRWNRALLENSARPSGALVYQPGDGGNLSPDQFDRLKAELEAGYTGAARAGRPMLLEGGLDWKAMGLSPKDMDFIEARREAAREIALAFGVPPMLIGIPGDATYANYAEANRAFFRLTVLPLAARLAGALGRWLGAHLGEPELRLAHDLDRVDGLSQEREALWARLKGADFLDGDEKREAVGYGPRGGGGAA